MLLADNTGARDVHAAANQAPFCWEFGMQVDCVVYPHTVENVYSQSDWCKIRLALNLPELNYWRKSGHVCTVLGAISGLILSQGLSEGGAISGVDCTHVYICTIDDDSLEASRTPND